MAPPRFIFTITAGRTGSDWLGKFLKVNLGIHTVHEPLGIADMGTEMPDTRQLRSFNDLGWTREIDAFWHGKLGRIGAREGYAETNHVLSKAGLIEALSQWAGAPETAVICLRRDPAAQILSYLERSDFTNIAGIWQWFLDLRYRNVILDPAPFKPFGALGHATWYALEMRAREAYYRQLFGDTLRFVQVDLEAVTTSDGAAGLLASLDRDTPAPILPEKANSNPPSANRETARAEVASFVDRVSFDADALARAYIASGRRLDAPLGTDFAAATAG